MNQIPSHNHTLSFTANSGGVGTIKTYGTVYSVNNQSIVRITSIPTSGELAYWGIDKSGGGGSHNNMQPYSTIFMWRRVS